jgi:hypothetical protein
MANTNIASSFLTAIDRQQRQKPANHHNESLFKTSLNTQPDHRIMVDAILAYATVIIPRRFQSTMTTTIPESLGGLSSQDGNTNLALSRDEAPLYHRYLGYGIGWRCGTNVGRTTEYDSARNDVVGRIQGGGLASGNGSIKTIRVECREESKAQMEVDEGEIRENSRRRPYRQPKSVTLIDGRIPRQQSIRRLRIPEAIHKACSLRSCSHWFHWWHMHQKQQTGDG